MAAAAKRKKILATLSVEERLEYARRRDLFDQAHVAALAAGAYLDAYGQEIRAAHDLPAVFDLNLETGKVTEKVDG